MKDSITIKNKYGTELSLYNVDDYDFNLRSGESCLCVKVILDDGEELIIGHGYDSLRKMNSYAKNISKTFLIQADVYRVELNENSDLNFYKLYDGSKNLFKAIDKEARQITRLLACLILLNKQYV